MFKGIIVIGLVFLYGCGTPYYDPFIQELRTNKVIELCREYEWSQTNRQTKVSNPSTIDVCMDLHRCAITRGCILGLPGWHYDDSIR